MRLLKCSQFCRYWMASTTYTAESTKMDSDHHQAVWNPQKSPRPRRAQT